jgi:hypothetical protein
MSPLARFFHELLRDGRMILRELPAAEVDAELAHLLRAAYAEYCLDIAGPAPAFDEPTALAAARVVYDAGWALVSQRLPVAELEKRLRMPARPRTAAQHLSADLLLRYLPQVHRRARARDPADPFPATLEKVLWQWPLSGVLADLDEGPETALEFDHPGLMLLYAERLAQHPKPAWVPTGKALEYVDLVWEQLHKDPAFLRQAQTPEERLAEEGARFDE